MTLTDQTTRPLGERYELLRKTLAHYLLLQVGTFIEAFGFEAIGPSMNVLTERKAELKVQEVKRQGGSATGVEAVEALSHNLALSMGETFNSDYSVEVGDGVRTVKLERCGCIESVLEQSEQHGLTKPQARSVFCGACVGSYKKSAESLGLKFAARLTGEAGCSMSFSTGQPELGLNTKKTGDKGVT